MWTDVLFRPFTADRDTGSSSPLPKPLVERLETVLLYTHLSIVEVSPDSNTGTTPRSLVLISRPRPYRYYDFRLEFIPYRIPSRVLWELYVPGVKGTQSGRRKTFLYRFLPEDLILLHLST